MSNSAIYDYKNIKLNLGSGDKKAKKFLNIDILPLPNVDIVHDLEQGIPLHDNSVIEVHAYHILEHIPDSVKIFEEIYRVCQPGSIVKLKVPYFKSIGAFKDPTHKSFFTEKTFEYFDKSKINDGVLPEYQIKADFRVKKISYIWSSKWIRFLPYKKNFFMKYFWNIARTMYIELKVIK